MTAINLAVVDLYHGDLVSDFAKAKIAGVHGVIHKASQGASITDSMYPLRRKRAITAGMLWGAYHFMTAAPAELQVAAFLHAADPDDRTLMALDFEPGANSKATPNLALLREMLLLIEGKLKRKAVIYSGSLLKETMGASHDDYLASHRLWLCEYADRWKLAPLVSWEKPWLWQYTDGRSGPFPRTVDGIPGASKCLDCNHYDGTPAQLAAEWAA
jgi:GH25 family lysozyme M1 (1,4-beta-N-acetylmuramidase)